MLKKTFFKRSLTPRAYKEWSRSEDGYRAECSDVNYDPKKCKRALIALGTIHKKNTAKKWEECLRKAEATVRSAYEGGIKILTDESYRTIQKTKIAEYLMMEAGFSPPHWTGWIECKSCGPMMCLPGEKKCPWCIYQPPMKTPGC